jgi:hypothetical protein
MRSRLGIHYRACRREDTVASERLTMKSQTFILFGNGQAPQ